MVQKEKKQDCSDCPAWSGTDCTNNPYLDGCLKDPKNDEWLHSSENPERRIQLNTLEELKKQLGDIFE